MIIFINFYWLINDWKILCSSFLRLCSNYRQERKTILCVSKLRRLHIKVRSFPFSKIRICESAILYRSINQLCLQYVCTYEYIKTYPICTRIHDISNNILDRIKLTLTLMSQEIRHNLLSITSLSSFKFNYCIFTSL